MVPNYNSCPNLSPNYGKYGYYKQNNREQQEKYRTIERYVFSTFFNNFIYLIDKQYQNTSLVQISAQARQKYGYYKQNNREQQEKYRTIERQVFSIFFNNFISLIDKWYQNTSLVQMSVQTREQYGYYKQNNIVLYFSYCSLYCFTYNSRIVPQFGLKFGQYLYFGTIYRLEK